MTDNEKLIEEALVAYWGGAMNAHVHGSAAGMRAAFAVFEKALGEATDTPTDDEREALADRLARRLVDDPEQLMLAEGTGALHVALSGSIRSVIEDVYADCGDSDPGVLSSNIARRLAWDLPPAILADARFRRSEVPEPSADEREALIDGLLATKLISGYDWLGTGSSYPTDDEIRHEVGEVADAVLRFRRSEKAHTPSNITPTYAYREGYESGFRDGERGEWRGDDTSSTPTGDELCNRLEVTNTQIREELHHRQEYAEAHGYPTFQDDASAFIDGAEWMRDVRSVADAPDPTGQVLAWIDRTLALPMYQNVSDGEYGEAVVTTLTAIRKMLNGSTRADASWRTASLHPDPMTEYDLSSGGV